VYLAVSISSALSRQCAVPYCRLQPANLINGTVLCPGHTAAVRGRLVRMRLSIEEFKGDVLQLLRTEYSPPAYSTPAARRAAGAPAPGHLTVQPHAPEEDLATECECRHSLGAHVREGRQCSFCSCLGFQEWVNPDVVVAKPLPRDVAAALEKLGEQPGFRDLAHEHLVALGKYGRRRYFAGGSILFDRGDASDRVYLLLSGELQTELPLPNGGERIVRFEPGDIVGTRALLRGTEHVAPIRANCEVYALELTKDEVRESFRRNMSLALAFMRMVRARMTARTAREPAPAG
jgi:hypothetical protein